MMNSGPIITRVLLSLCLVACGDDEKSPVEPTHEDHPEDPPLASFADADLGITNPTALAFSPEGKLFVCSLNGRGSLHFNGQVLVIEDINGDGIADSSTVFADQLETPVGLAFHGSDVFVSTYGAVMVFNDTDGDNRADVSRELVSLIPWGMHVNNGIAIGPDDKLYITQGSEFNLETGGTQIRSAILQCNLDGSDLRIFARGLRNPYDVAFNADGDLFATDNGPDGDEINALEAENPDDILFPEELNHIVENGHYGFPDEYGQPAEGSDTIGPVAEWITHAGAQGLAFNTGSRFFGYDGDLFVAMYHAGRIDAVELTKIGDSYEATLKELIEFPCMSGDVFPQPTGHHACLHMHPLDLTFGPDGDLYIAAFGIVNSDLSPRITGVIYKVSAL